MEMADDDLLPKDEDSRPMEVVVPDKNVALPVPPIEVRQPPPNPTWKYAVAVILTAIFSVVIPGISQSLQLQGVVDVDVARIILVLTWIAAMCSICWCVSIWPNATARRKIIFIASSGLCLAALFIAVHVWAVHSINKKAQTDKTQSNTIETPVGPSAEQIADAISKRLPKPERKADSAKATPPSVSLFLSCDFVSLPVRVQRGEFINLLHVPTPIGLARMTVGSEDYDFGLGFNGSMLRRCELVNDSAAPVFAVHVELPLFSQEVPESSGLVVPKQDPPYDPSIEALGNHKQPFRVERIDSAGRFTFYVQNISKNFVVINAPAFVTLEVHGSRERLRVPLRASLGMSVLTPRRAVAK